MSRYLLDTHVVLWCFTNDPTLAEGARRVIVDKANTIFVSAVNSWEITIKKALGKLRAPENFEEMVRQRQFTPLPITIAHTLAVGDLPLGEHKDPFDRLLVAQTKVEDLTLITRDADLGQYGIPILTA